MNPIEKNVDDLLKSFFKTDKANKDDWTSRDAWRRRALGWKILALCATEGDAKDPSFRKLVDEAKQCDLQRSPNALELIAVARFAEKYIHKKKFESKIIIAR